jgi:peptide/nickel transport system substrate-binding protein
MPCVEGRIAESWEFPDSETMIFHIREGIHWQDKAPMNGRELVAEDVAWNFRRWYSPEGRFYRDPPKNWVTSVDVPDKYTVIVHVNTEAYSIPSQFLRVSDYQHILPPEVIEAHGDMRDWKNVVGAGPFILEELVPESSLIMVRNPNYWRDDPLHPGNRLPYLDKIDMMYILDYSTRLAAFRTGKIDYMARIEKDDGDTLREKNPDVVWKFDLKEQGTPIFMRTDLPPFNDVRVRQAMQMAINEAEIVEDFYGGAAEILSFPIPAVPDYAGMYTPIDELPPTAKEMFGYHPDKAKQLLAEAGYPDGFQAEVSCIADYEEMLSIYAAYLADVGIDLKLDVKEASVWRSAGKFGGFESMHIDPCSLGGTHDFADFQPGEPENMSGVDDAYVNERVPQIWSFENMQNTALQERLAKEANLRLIEQAYVLQTPVPYVYTMWWPWVKGYSGEYGVGHYDKFGFAMYPWIDKALKKSMGH